jgi:hypothetical protein
MHPFMGSLAIDVSAPCANLYPTNTGGFVLVVVEGMQLTDWQA